MERPHDHAKHEGHSEHGHDHAGEVSALKNRTQKRSVLIALLITVTFMVVELVGGWYSNSLALLSDAGHMATDAVSLSMALATLWLVSLPVSKLKWSFGFARAEVLAALLNGITIWLLAGFLVYEALLRLQDPPHVEGPIVFGVALIGLVANLLSMKALHGHHGHGSLNIRAAYLHLAADLMGSIGAIIAGAVLWWTGWQPIDLIITFVFSALMVVGSWELIKESFIVLMEGVPAAVDAEAVANALKGLDGVQDLHDLHIWTVSSHNLALSAHLIIEDQGSGARAAPQVLKAACLLLEKDFGILHTTLQLEVPSQFESARCYDCAT